MPVFQKQLMMRRVLYSLAPIYLFSLYLYGWRVLVLSVAVFGLGILTEYFMEKTRKKKVSEAVLVTCALFTMAMPPLVPLWMAGVGIIFAVFIGKEVYGGFGRNIYNPAITGRTFIYISFPIALASGWAAPTAWMNGGPFGLNVDAMSGATPLSLIRQGEFPDLANLFFGLRPGSIGEGPIFLIILAGIYLIYTKTANWRLMAGYFLSVIVLASALFFAGVDRAMNPLYSLLSGSIFFVGVFMVTDPVSGPKRPVPMWLYGILIGSCAVIIRTFSLFPEGTSFALLIGNTFAALLDEVFGTQKKKQKVAA